MIQRRSRLCLVNKALFGFLITGQILREEFERNKAFELGVFGFVHYAHAPAAEPTAVGFSRIL